MKLTELSRSGIPWRNTVVTVILIVAVTGMAIWQPWKSALNHADAKNLIILASGDTEGWIEPCGCTANQSGGLPRRATYAASARKSGEVLLLDAGGAPGGTSAYDRLKFEAILKGELAMGVAAHNIGRSEAQLGDAVLRGLAAKESAPFVSSNVHAANDRLLAPPFRIISAGGRMIAVLGVLAPEFGPPDMKVSDPKSAILETLAAAKGKFNLSIVLAYLPPAQFEALATSLPEVDIVIGGPTGQTLAPRRTGPTWLVAVTNKGKFLARFDVPPGRPADESKASIVELNSGIADDPLQTANIARYQIELKHNDFKATDTSFAPQLATIPSGYNTVGTKKCLACHETASDVWSHSVHAHAWQTLVTKARQFDSLCQRCHTTAYGLPGGFDSVAESSDRVDVGCESCHGPGAAHSADPTRRTFFNARDQCISCHDAENSPKFEFVAYWNRIKHGP